MPVAPYNIGDLFTFRVIKHHQLNPDRKWANTYEFKATGAGAETELLELGTALVNWEATLALEVVVYDRLLISTWAPDSKPYDPEAFIVSTLTDSGQNAAVTDPEPLNMCLSVARVAATGRSGHIFLRGVLKEGDVASPAGTHVLVNRAAIQSQVDTALTDSGLADFITADSRKTLQMVMIGKTSSQVRGLVTLRAQGVTTLPMDHAWFNRTSPTPP